MKRQTFSQTIVWFLLLLALACAPLGQAQASDPATQLPTAANGGVISGTLVTPDSAALPEGTRLKLFDPGTEKLIGQAVPDPISGAFSFPKIANGLYLLKGVPPESSNYTQSLPRSVSVANTPVNVGQLSLTFPQITGTVFAPDGVTPVPAEVFVHLGDGRVFQRLDAPAGVFQVGGLPVGSYFLRAEPAGEGPFWRSVRQALVIPAINSSQVRNLTLRPAQAWGKVQDEFGKLVPGVRLTTANSDGEHAVDISNASGFWSLGGLPEGEYTLSVTPPKENPALLPPEPIIMTLPDAASPRLIELPAPEKILSGQILTNTGLPVQAAEVRARRLNQAGIASTSSGADGSYTLQLGPGLWSVTVHQADGTQPSDWVHRAAPRLVHFDYTPGPENKQEDFEVTLADADVHGLVALPGGGAPAFAVTIELFSSEGGGMQVSSDPIDGSFHANLPHGGYKVLVHSSDPAYLGPVVEPVQLPTDGDLDLGRLTLLARDAVLSGVVTDQNGTLLGGIPLVAWRTGAPGVVQSATGPDGQYALGVAAGDWQVRPAPEASQPYLYNGPALDASASAGETLAGLDFSLTNANAEIRGVLVDEQGQPLSDLNGWAVARQVNGIQNGAPVEGGTFSILVPAGSYKVGIRLPAGSRYMNAQERSVTVTAGAVAGVTIRLEAENARISGYLWDPRHEDVVENLPGVVMAWDAGSWVAAPLRAATGTYSLEVAAGIWRVNYRLKPEMGYVKLRDQLNTFAEAGKETILRLPVVPLDAYISGQVLDPEGQPLAGVLVTAFGTGSVVRDVEISTRSEADGGFSLHVPHGLYALGATAGPAGTLRPVDQQVNAPQGLVSGGHSLQFRQADALLNGTLTVDNLNQDGMVHVWAWSDDGAFASGHFPVNPDGLGHASGAYTLGLIQGTTWHVSAVFENASQAWRGSAAIALDEPAASLDLVLDGPNPKPGPVVVRFDSNLPQHIELADGTRIFIPAGAMPVEGLVTLSIVPLAGAPDQRHANLTGLGYAFQASTADGEPIVQAFNQDVVISFTYTDAQLQRHLIREEWLKPAYFSTTENRWVFPESYIVDRDNNLVSMQIDHFTDYALTSTAVYATFLPMASK